MFIRVKTRRKKLLIKLKTTSILMKSGIIAGRSRTFRKVQSMCLSTTKAVLALRINTPVKGSEKNSINLSEKTYLINIKNIGTVSG